MEMKSPPIAYQGAHRIQQAFGYREDCRVFALNVLVCALVAKFLSRSFKPLWKAERLRDALNTPCSGWVLPYAG